MEPLKKKQKLDQDPNADEDANSEIKEEKQKKRALEDLERDLIDANYIGNFSDDEEKGDYSDGGGF